MKLNRIISICLLYLNSVVYSQNLPAGEADRTIDSLMLVLKKAKHDTTRVSTYLSLGEQIYLQQPDSALALWKKAQTLAEKNLKTCLPTQPQYSAFKKHLANSLNNIAVIYDSKGDISKALEYLSKSLKLQEEIGDKKGISQSLNNIGTIYKSQGNIPKALEYQGKSLKIREEIGDRDGIAQCLNNIGTIYYSQGDFPKALEYQGKSLKIQEEVGDKNGVSQSLNNIGTIYDSQGDIPRALEYYSKSLQILEEIGDKNGIASSMNNIGAIYYSKGDIPKALEYLSKSLKIQEEIGDKKGIAGSMSNLASIYLKLASLPAESAEHTGAEKASANRQKNYNKAIEYCGKSLKTSKELGFPENIRNAAQQLSQIYKATGDHKNALENYELFILMRDSINNIATKKASIKSQVKYEYEKKEQAAKAQQEKKDLKAEEEKQKQTIIRNSFIGGFVLVFILATLILRSFSQKKKANKLLEEKNSLIEKQKHEVEEKQKEILDSIRYAKRIQTALITNENYIASQLNKLINQN